MNVGDVVTLKIKNLLWDKRHLYGFDIKEFKEYTGTVVPNLKGLGPDVVCITTGHRDFPVRIIEKDLIVGSNVPVDKPKINFESWVVLGSKGSKYNITRSDNHYECSCPSYQFRRTCKHINELKTRLAA